MSVLEILNDKQKEAASIIDGPVLILAGAGSGKTRVLTNRTAYMIDEMGISPWNILAITFTNKAADEMRSRIDTLVGHGSESIWVATFHSTCVRILRRHIDLIGYDNSFTIYDTDDSKSLMREVLKRLQIDPKQYPEKRFLNWISNCKNELSTPEDEAEAALGDIADELYAKVYREYQDSLQKNNALDFDDLLMKAVELFKKCPEVLANYQNRFRYIMVDEYQDTNTAQFEFVRLLAAAHRNICVVGDDDQSIYKFRGANIRNILDFEKVYPEAKVIKLEQNYRSTQTILDAANAVISNNSGRKEKSLWTDKGEGDRIRFINADTAEEEAELIVDRICREKRSGKYDFSDNAVLYRTNAQSRVLEAKCNQAGVPCQIVGGVNFYARREIKDILAYLKTIDNGKDDLAVRRIINVPKRGIGATTITKLVEYGEANGLDFYECCARAEEILAHGRATEKIQEFTSLIGMFKSQIGLISLAELVEDIIDRTDYEDMLIAEDENEAKERMENIGELVNAIVSYEERNDEPTLSGFLEEVALVSDIDRVDENTDKVMLMTLHSAKGLEFPNVYLAGMEDGLFPGFMSISSADPAELEEERRLCYVGITRAMEHLCISAAKSRMVWGQTQHYGLSRFVSEIPEELFEGRVVSRSAQTPHREDSYGQSSYGGGASTTVGRVRPVIVSPQKKAAAAKPFIAKAVDFTSLKKGSDMSNGQAPDYGPGDRVSHMKFGAGTVVSVEKGAKDYEVTVDFDTAGTKKMFAAFAKLKRL